MNKIRHITGGTLDQITLSSIAKDAVELADIGVWLWDLKNSELYLSPAWKNILGYRDEELINMPQTWIARIHPDDLDFFTRMIENYDLRSDSPLALDYRLRHRDGSYHWMTLRAKGFNVSTENLKLIGIQYSIHREKSYELDILNNALQDSLTGLDNRLVFMQRLEYEFNLSKRNKRYHFAVHFIDVDKLKNINDTYGHSGGDAFLKAISARIKECCREIDTVCRVGGDEFIVIQSQVKSKSNYEEFVNRLLDKIKEPFFINGIEIMPSVSIGITSSYQHYARLEDILQNADIATYEAKAITGPSYVVYQPGGVSSLKSKFYVVSSLQTAVQHSELNLNYQPIYTVEEQDIVGFEALLRWQHPTLGHVAPLEFLPIIEDTEVIFSIEEFVIQKACCDLVEIIEKHNLSPNTHISINISARQLESREIVKIVESAIKAAGLRPNNIIFEIAESILLNCPSAKAILQYLKDLGIKLALDNFGSGILSLSTLNAHPFDIIKVDRNFIENLDKSYKTQKTLQLICNMAKELGIQTIAKGVQTQEELLAIKACGFDQAQGFYFAHPVSLEQIQI